MPRLRRFVWLIVLRGQRVLSLNWIHSKIISGATFRIIGLTKIPKMEFLPLDWIYCSIRIITVHTSANAVTLVWGSKTSKSSDGFVHVMNINEVALTCSQNCP